MLSYRSRWLLFIALSAFLVSACGADGDDPKVPVDPEQPEEGQTEFWSAHGNAGQEARDDLDAAEPPMAGAPEGDDGRGEDATVEEGDIYRLMGDGTLLNLNSYRGLQVIDTQDLDNPQVIGRAAMSGYPVEMYVVDQTAYVLMNNWRGYYGSRFDSGLARVDGGVVIAVDLSDLTAPRILDQRPVEGHIQRSRVVRDSNAANLFVASQRYRQWDEPLEDGETWYGRTFVSSFDISDRKVEPITEIALGGYVTDIQATPRYLMVARGTERWWSRGEGSTVTLIDITDPRGTMIVGSETQVRGQVNSQFNMDIHGDVMRIVSGSRWGSHNTNWLQTWNIEDITAPALVDEVSFGDDMDLYATIFLGNKAFFVTYFRVDPFHAFEITDEGYAEEISEFIVSGWNDFFRPVLGETRLIGIGINDEDGQRVAVSLYDITDLTNENPLVQRREVASQWSWSEANWDHRAFSVLENAVDVQAADGTRETGLVLLPYSGYGDVDGRGYGSYRSAVQLFTFSADTLTARGTLAHNSPVRRSFLAEAQTAANLSETELSLHDISNPDAPTERGSLDLAPHYTQILHHDGGAFLARVRGTTDWYGYGYSPRDMTTAAQVQIIAAPATDLDAEAPIATFDIHGQATVYLQGDTLWAVSYLSTPNSPHSGLRIQRWDLADPTAPSLAQEFDLRTDRLRSYNYYGGWCDGFGCWGGWGYQRPDAALIGNALVMQQVEYHSERVGTVESCYEYLRGQDRPCDSDPEGGDGDGCHTQTHGSRYCTRENSQGAFVCHGTFERCDTEDGEYSCSPYEPPASDVRRDCHTYDNYRYWNQTHFEVVDLSGSEPSLRPRITMPVEHETVGHVVDGDQLWFASRTPARRPGDTRPYMRYWVRTLDFSNASAPQVGEPINVPGRLVAVHGDRMIFEDLVYHSGRIHTALARARVADGRASLEAFRRLDDISIGEFLFEENGLALITVHDTQPWYHDRPGGVASDDVAVGPGYPGGWARENPTQLLILDALGSNNFQERARVDIDFWAQLRATRKGQAVFQVNGGMVVFNLSDATRPWPQAWLPMQGWPQSFLVAGDTLHVAAGRHGIYSFDLDETNLLPPR